LDVFDVARCLELLSWPSVLAILESPVASLLIFLFGMFEHGGAPFSSVGKLGLLIIGTSCEEEQQK